MSKVIFRIACAGAAVEQTPLPVLYQVAAPKTVGFRTDAWSDATEDGYSGVFHFLLISCVWLGGKVKRDTFQAGAVNR
jgi:hypothetical protein